jgi:hypothetical protein
MNHDEHRMKRLFEAASKSQPETPAEIPFALEKQIIARWRSSAPEEEPDLPGLAVLIRRAVVCAVLIMVVSAGWSRLNDTREVPGALALTKLAQAVQIIP